MNQLKLSNRSIFLKRKSGYLIFLWVSLALLASCKKPAEQIEPAKEVIKLVEETDINFLNKPAKLFKLSIEEEDMPLRFVEIRALKRANNAKGALILTQGGFGASFYGSGFEKNTTINQAHNLGLEVFELRWLGEFGWATNTQGAGYPKAVRAFKEITIWLKKNQMLNPSKVITHGGSGGSFQIAYGLTTYNLEEEIDFAILVAGPPTSDLQRAIFGGQADEARWAPGIGGYGITDMIHGWRDNGDYSKNNHLTPPPFVLEALDKSSLLSKTEARDFSYRTKIFFVNTNDNTRADKQGRLYYDAILSEKEWHYLPDETSHDVSGIPAGAEKIRSLIKRITEL
jgi:hypothetical protein